MRHKLADTLLQQSFEYECRHNTASPGSHPDEMTGQISSVSQRVLAEQAEDEIEVRHQILQAMTTPYKTTTGKMLHF